MARAMTANIPTANTVTDNDQTASPESTEYLAHLQRFSANSGNVVITANVVNAQGVLLVAKGERLTESHTQKIIRHKLARPIEECVGLEPMLHPKSLKQRIDELLAQRPDVAECIQVSKASIGLMPCLVFVNTFPIVIQKLTVLEASMVHVYEQALINALLCLALVMYLNTIKRLPQNFFLLPCVKILVIYICIKSLVKLPTHLHIFSKNILSTQ